ncbi:MAG: putative Ig domain-containing protein [Bacteroidia bacterium]
MKTKLLLAVLTCAVFSMSSCKKNDDDNTTNGGSTLRILTSPTGQNQTISANIDNTGYTNFNAQTILADGGAPLNSYTWSLDLSSNPPAGITIGTLTGVVNRLGHSSTGLSVGTTTFRVTVSDGNATRTESIDLVVTGYTPGSAAVLQQLSSNFALVNGIANKPYGASLWVTGGTPPYSWSLDNTYPGSVDLTNAGLTVDATTGVVRGTILNSAAGSTINFKVIVTDSAGDVAIFSPVYTIQVD